LPDRSIERWKTLRHTGVGDGELEVPSLSSGVETGYGPVRFALGPDGQPRLLVPCGPGATLTSSEGMQKLAVTLTRFTLAGRASVFIDVMSVDRSLDPVFAELAEEILHRLSAGNGPGLAVEGTIADFRELLSESQSADVPDISIYGLIGELYVLRELARKSPAAIEAWTGPYEQRHDFRRREHALEIKTSAREDATIVSISSCDQLAAPSGGTLSLIHIRVERADCGLLSVSALSRQIVDLGVQRASLARGLAALGCLDPDAPEWNRIRCNLEGVTLYRIEDGFPRITSRLFDGGAVPTGIVDISYDVDLQAAREFRIAESETEYVLTRVVQ
jgi:hypothetical protein